MASRKRAADADGGSDPKKPRGSARGPSFLPPQGDLKDLAAQNAGAPAAGMSAELARKRAEIAAKFAAMANPAAAAARSAPAPVPTPVAPPGAPPNLAKKIAEAAARVKAMQEKSKNPYLSSSGPGASASSGPTAAGIHPLLAQQSSGATTSYNRYKPMAPKFATVRANVSSAPQPAAPRQDASTAAAPAEDDHRNNPYFDSRLAEGSTPKERTHRNLRFNTKGKFIRQAEQARSEARLEELKKRIEQGAQKAGLDAEMETVQKQVRRPPPPVVEWWDEDYLPNKTYDDVINGEAAKRIRSAESPIDIFIQHPIQLSAPGDKLQIALKPLKLTKKEMKKMRRQRRRQELQDKQDRQRMGLLPPDPPKVKLSNMMKVLTNDSVSDPTKVEARVRREMQQRRRAHERDNEARKLTDEDRRAKAEKKKEDDEAKGIHCVVFRIRYLSNGQHRFKVRKNAEQYGLTGVAIFNPKFALVIAEGGLKGVKAYKHLMLDRINWTEEPLQRAAAAGAADDDGGASLSPPPPPSTSGGDGAASALQELPASLKDNTCHLIWEGESRERAFKAFRPRNCPSDGVAKQFLGPRMEGFWDVAKKWTDAEV